MWYQISDCCGYGTGGDAGLKHGPLEMVSQGRHYRHRKAEIGQDCFLMDPGLDEA